MVGITTNPIITIHDNISNYIIDDRIKKNLHIDGCAFLGKNTYQPNIINFAIFAYMGLRHPFSHYGIADVHFIGMFFITIIIVSINVCINTIV